MRKLSKEQVLLLHTQLIEDYAELLARKKEAYREYRKAKQEMTDFATAKYDIEQLPTSRPAHLSDKCISCQFVKNQLKSVFWDMKCG